MGGKLVMNRKILFVLIILVSILAISAVSASSDINSTDDEHVLNEKINEQPILEESNGENILDEGNDETVLSAGTGTFTDLNNLINGNDRPEITLDRDYKYDGDNLKSGIKINRNLIIYGNGHTLDANTYARIFYIAGGTVKFYNITFINGNTNHEGASPSGDNHYDGAAILGACTAINCYFGNNVAGSESCGGAMYEGTAINCTFKNNKACNGGAMYEGTAINCTFIENKADSYVVYNDCEGGAIYKGTAINCTFTDNFSGSYGGAAAYITATNCTFTNNKAENDGGALDASIAINCTFIGNEVEDNDGGAMFGGTATNCYFKNNYACDWGGAMSRGTAINCTFDSNIGDDDGGALYESDAINCTFIGNKANDDDGGAMYGGTATNCIFINNHANDDGGAICKGTAINCTFIGNTADRGNSMYQGTAILCRSTNSDDYYETNIIPATIVVNNIICPRTSTEKLYFSLTAGGKNYNGFNTTIEIYQDDKLFDTVYALTGEGWTIDLAPGVYTAKLSIDKSYNIPPAYATITIIAPTEIWASDLATTYNSGECMVATLVNYDGNPVKNVAVSVEINGNRVNYTTDDYGQIFIPSQNLALGTYPVNIDFAGEGLYMPSHATVAMTVTKATSVITAAVVVTTFNLYEDLEINLKETHGNPISNAVVSVNFNGVTANYTTDKNGQIKVSTKGLHEGTYTVFIDFKGNENYTGAYKKTKVEIGTIGNLQALDLIISGASEGRVILENNFKYNADTDTGLLSGISIYKDNLVIDGQGHTIDGGDEVAIFRIIGNNVTLYNITLVHAKNAITWTGENGTINCSNFANHTGEYGSVVTWEGKNGEIYKSQFINTTGQSKGAVYWKGENGLVEACTFINNNAYNGAAIYWSPTGENGTVKSSYFANNNAYLGGGAIYFDGENGCVDDCQFINNTVYGDDSAGGAIYWEAINGLINNCYFENNSAEKGEVEYKGGGAIYFEGYGMINGSSFINNSATYGGAILCNHPQSKGNITINNSEFKANKAKYSSNIHKADGKTLLFNSALEANATISQVEDCQVHTSKTIYITFDDGTNFKEYAVILLNDGKEIKRLNKNSSGNYQFTLDNLAAGSYLITVEGVDDDGNTFEAENLMEFKVSKFNSTVTVYPISQVHYAETVIVNFEVENKTELTYEIKDSNGYVVQIGNIDSPNTFSFTIGVGTYTITIFNNENDTYYESSASANFTVDKFDSNVTINPITAVHYGENVTVNFTVENRTTVSYEIKDSNGNIVQSGIIKADSLTVEGLKADSYTIIITNEEDYNYRPSQASAGFTVMKYKTVLTAPAVTTVYNGGKYLVATLKDENGNALKNFKVSINLNGKTKTLTTDTKGQVKLTTNSLAPKTYSAKISFAGTDKYAPASVNAKVVVKKANAKIVAKKKTFKKSKKVKKYTITLKSGKMPIKKVQLTIKIGKKTYKAKTNNKGKATFKIKKLTKKGTYKATIKFKGNKYYKKATKKVKIRIK